MKRDEFDWSGGRVTYWELDAVDPAAPFDAQRDELKEDLAQVRFEGGLILDIGWYPQHAPEGRFVIVVVREEEWDPPIARFEARGRAELDDAVRRGIAAAGAGRAG
jgi:hypothetical protein